jgi:predicted nucleic acid-binding protein
MPAIEDVTRSPNQSAVRSAAASLVLDTNVVLDWLVFGDAAACWIGQAIVQGQLLWLSTPRMLSEWRAVVASPLGARWDPARQRALTADLTAWCRLHADVAPGAQMRLACSDPDDQIFIDLALLNRPCVLLTRDRALLALRRRALARGVTISTPRAWVATEEATALAHAK